MSHIDEIKEIITLVRTVISIFLVVESSLIAWIVVNYNSFGLMVMIIAFSGLILLTLTNGILFVYWLKQLKILRKL